MEAENGTLTVKFNKTEKAFHKVNFYFTEWLFRQNHPGPWFNIKMTSYQYRKSHCGDKTILRPSYLHNGISYTGKMTSLYWIRAQVATNNECLVYTMMYFPAVHVQPYQDIS